MLPKLGPEGQLEISQGGRRGPAHVLRSRCRTSSAFRIVYCASNGSCCTVNERSPEVEVACKFDFNVPKGPEDQINIRILQTTISGILLLDLRTRMWDLYA